MSQKTFVAGRVLHVGEDTFEFGSAREAISALRWITFEPSVEYVGKCSWLVEAPPVWASDPESDWFPDSPADMIRECGGLVVGTARGWQGLCGHSHVSGAEYYEEEEVRHLMQDGYLVPQDAFLMDGRPVEAAF